MSHVRAEPSNPRSAELRSAIIVVEEPAESLAAANATSGPPWVRRVDEFVAKILLIPLVVIMLDERCDRPSQVAFPEENHSTKTFGLDRAHESFGVRIRIGRLKRIPDVAKSC
jgi:hypothetical protein